MPPSDRETEPRQAAAARRWQRKFVAVLASAALHLVVMSIGAFAAVLARRSIGPPNSLMTLGVALILAHCSTTGIGWARSDWSASAKTTAALLCSLGLWLTLMLLLRDSAEEGPRASAWAMCLLLQTALTAAATTALDVRSNRQHA